MSLLHTDIPTRAQVDRLLEANDPVSVSVYLPTSPSSSGDAERIELKNLTRQALDQLADAGVDKRDVSAVEEAFEDVGDDAELWRFPARSLAVFVTPTSLVTFRLPNALSGVVEVADRFYLKPLLRAVAFPQTALVLALAQGSARVIEIVPDAAPFPVKVADMPTDVASAVGKASIKDRSPSGRLQGAEGQKVRMRQYARQVDQALRPLLSGLDVPLILAATEPMDSIYRSVNTYPHLAAPGVAGLSEPDSDTELVQRARAALDEVYADQLRALHERFTQRQAQDRVETDLAALARAATYGMVDTLLVDIDEIVPGEIDDDGAVTFADDNDAVAYGVVDEIARRAWLQGGRVLAVRRDDIPGGTSAAAILRYRL